MLNNNSKWIIKLIIWTDEVEATVHNKFERYNFIYHDKWLIIVKRDNHNILLSSDVKK